MLFLHWCTMHVYGAPTRPSSSRLLASTQKSVFVSMYAFISKNWSVKKSSITQSTCASLHGLTHTLLYETPSLDKGMAVRGV